MSMHRHVLAGKLLAGLVAISSLALITPADISAEPLPVADVKHDGPVDFQKDILPILRRNCLACHNATDAESDLVLETPETILEGGAEGPSAVAGNSGESLMFKLAMHATDPVMPPEDNDVGAKNLSPEQLGLLKLWIDQGAKGEVTDAGGPIAWQPLPATVNPVYALAVSPHGEYVAAGRANQIFIYNTATKSTVTRLTDAALIEQGIYKNPGVAHLDIVQSLAFSPDGKWLASGGYRTVKIWERPTNPQLGKLEGIEGEPQSLAVSPDGKLAAVGEAGGKVKLFDVAAGKVTKTFEGHGGPVSGVAFSSDGALLATGCQDKTFRVFNIADGKELGKTETPAPVNAVAFVLENKQVATGHADNKLFTWHLPGTEPAPPEDEEPAEGEQAAQGPKPIKEFGGHAGAITSLLAVNNGTQLLSGSQDSTMRHWDANGGNQIRQFSPGGPVASVAVSPDGSKFAAACTNNMAKVFRADNGQQLAEVKGDHRLRLAQDDANRAVALAKRHVDNAKKDLDEAQKRLKSEEENAKKAEENQKKTQEEMKQKEEAAKKPVEEKQKADEELAAIMPQFEQAEKDKVATEEAAAKTTETQTASQKKRDDANKVASDAQNVVNAASQKLQQAQNTAKAAADKVTSTQNTVKAAEEKLANAQNAAKDKPDDQGLTDAVKAAEEEKKKADEALKAAETEKTTADESLKTVEKEKADADAALTKANEAKNAAEKEYQDAVAKNQEAQKAKNEAVQKFNDLNNKMNQAKNVVNQKAGPAQKATDELNAATRAYEAAVRSVERSKEAVQKAADAVPEFEAAHKQREEAAAQRQKEKEEADKAVPTGEKPVFAAAFTADGSALATAGEDGLVHFWSAENGAPVEVYEGMGGPVTNLAATSNSGLLALGKNGAAIVWNASPDWKLVRTIGSPDSSESFDDRVTALHFSPDSQFLATGGGEPSRSGELKIWKVADGSLVKDLPDAHSDTLFDLEFSPDGQFIASCASDRFAKVHRVDNGEFVRAFEGHTHHVMGVSWRADGRLLATSGADKVVKVWDAQTGDQTKTITGWKKEVTAIKFVAISDEMITAAGDPQVSMRDSNGGNKGGFSGPNDFVYTVRVSVDGKTFASGGESSIIRVWNEQKQPIATFEPPQQEEPAADQQAAN